MAVVSRLQTCHHLALVPTRWGLCGVGWTEYTPGVDHPFVDHAHTALLSRIITPGLPPLRLRAALLRVLPGATEVFADAAGNFSKHVVPDWFGELAQLLQGYFTNAMHPTVLESDYCHWTYWKPRLDLNLITPFQEKVLNVVAGIGRGQILSYAQVAARAGNPQAARAVGAALRANPWPILVPCHRVIGSSGQLTGFTAPGGIAAKRRMLELEQSHRSFGNAGTLSLSSVR
jgi:O-6-methylguanine DNA methyltransferase